MSTKNSWFVYMVETSKGQLYTGVSTDVKRRFNEHKDVYEKRSSKGAKFFRTQEPLAIVYQESFPCRASAQKREAQIKSLSRDNKVKLCQSA